jgi:hypothetical protein
MSRCRHLFRKMLSVSSVRSPSSRVNLRRLARPRRWPRRNSTACPMHRLMERQEKFEELSLLWAWSAELCLAIVGPS